MAHRILSLAAATFAVLVTGLFLGALSSRAVADETGVAKSCLKCHGDFAGRKDFLAGTVAGHSQKAKTLQIRLDGKDVFVNYGDATEKKIGMAIEPNVPITVVVKAEGEKLVAQKIATMPPVSVPEKQRVTAEEIKRLIEEGPAKARYALIDSRPAPRFQEGHIPTAQSFPLDQMEELRKKLPEDKGELLIFYCGGEHCTLSPMAAQMAEKWGYTNIKVYVAGQPDWSKRGNVLMTTRKYLDDKRGNYVLLDTRGAEAAKSGHIPGAVAMTPEEITGKKSRFPLDRKAPIILYGQGGDVARLAQAVKVIANYWGYQRVYVLDGGYEGFLASGGKPAAGEAATEIVYAPKPMPGEIAKDEFAFMVESKPDEALILDVRTPQEVQAGVIPGAKNIPVDELKVRLGELPKSAEIIIHCSTGMRAEMARTILHEAGYKARFLNDKIEIVGKKVYLGTTVTLDDEGQEPETPLPGKIEVATPDAELCNRFIRHGQAAFERRRYLEAKGYYWKAIMADPTSELAWRNYDMAVIYSLAERAQENPGCIGVPEAPVSAPAGANGAPAKAPAPGKGAPKKEKEGC